MQAKESGTSATRLAAVFGAAGLAIAAGIAFAIPDQFQSLSAVNVDKGIEDTGHPEAVERMRKNIKVTGVSRLRNGNGAFSDWVRVWQPETARRIASELRNDGPRRRGLDRLGGSYFFSRRHRAKKA